MLPSLFFRFNESHYSLISGTPNRISNISLRFFKDGLHLVHIDRCSRDTFFYKSYSLFHAFQSFC